MKLNLLMLLLLIAGNVFSQDQQAAITNSNASVATSVQKDPAPQVLTGSTHIQVSVNTEADDVKQWTIAAVPGSFPSATNIYLPGNLTKVVTIDERGHQSVEFKDKDKKIILRKKQLSDNIKDGYDGWLCTYYIYDEQGRLRFLLQPNAVEWLHNNSWNFSIQGGKGIADEYCFQYEYGIRQRLKTQKNPGAEEIYTVFDKKDRAVFIQDGNMRKKQQWMARLYDARDREVLTGMMNYTGTREELQNYVDGGMIGAAVKNTVLTKDETRTNERDILLKIQQDQTKIYQAGNSIVMEPGFSSDKDISLVMEIEDKKEHFNVNEIASIHENPVPPGIELIPLTITYYDTYDFVKEHSSSFSYEANYTQRIEADNASVGLNNTGKPGLGKITGLKVRTLPNPDDPFTGSWLTTVNFYDTKNRLVQVQSDNYNGGRDIVTNSYDISGNLICKYLVHTNPKNINAALRSIKIKTNMEYDIAGHLIKMYKVINDDVTTKKMIVENEYDINGRLVRKELGVKGSNNGPIGVMDYSYNSTGTMKGINWKYEKNMSSPGTNMDKDKWFAMDMQDAGDNRRQKTWQSAGDMAERKYDMTFDNAHRLLSADFNQKFGDTWAKHAPGNSSFEIDYSTKVGNGIDPLTAYDANGNIKTLSQWGLKLNRSPMIDNLIYKYYPGSNTLQNVADAVSDPKTKLGDFKNLAIDMQADTGQGLRSMSDFQYDANGNLMSDGNNGITASSVQAIQYNYMNLPWRIFIKEKGTITYLYDAAGNKLEKRTLERATAKNNWKEKITVTNYLGDFTYENNQLQCINHEEGRIRVANNAKKINYVYDYFIKDNSGNVRMVLTDEVKTDIYPVASMETGHSKTENALYNNIDVSREKIPNGYPADNYTSPNNKVAKLNGNGNKIGPAIMLKVMAGDQLTFRVSSWYKIKEKKKEERVDILKDLLNAMTNSLAGIGNSKAFATGINKDLIMTPGLTNFLNDQRNTAIEKKPKAFVNWILFDGQYKFVPGSSGFEQVGADGEFKVHLKNNMNITRNGYLYIFVSNETPNVNVYFDNLQVSHIRGPLLEESHYYPFGLTMEGISYKAAGVQENKYKLIGAENNTDLGLNVYETHEGKFDPQLNRVWQSRITPRVILDISNGVINRFSADFPFLHPTLVY